MECVSSDSLTSAETLLPASAAVWTEWRVWVVQSEGVGGVMGYWELMCFGLVMSLGNSITHAS